MVRLLKPRDGAKVGAMGLYQRLEPGIELGEEVLAVGHLASRTRDLLPINNLGVPKRFENECALPIYM